MKPLYRCLAVAWIGDTIRAAGSEVEYDGEPGLNLQPLNEAAKLAKSKARHREPIEAPMLPEPSPPPVAPGNWMENAIKAGWLPPAMVDAIKAGQAPQPAPGAAPAGVEALNGPDKTADQPGGAAAALDKAAAGTVATRPEDAGI